MPGETQDSDSQQIGVQPLVHTPGPWVIKRRFDIYEDTGKPGVGGTYIGTVKGNGELPESVNARLDADARLIAAAPDLLDACQEISGWLESFSMPPTSTIGEKQAALRILRRAIAKAVNEVV